MKFNIYHLETGVPENAREDAAKTGEMAEETVTQLNDPMKPRRLPPRTKKYQPATKAKILELETWYLRMGGVQ